MFAKLSAFVSSAPTFPYSTGASYGTAWGCWTHHAGTKKDDSSEVSIFRISAQNKEDQKLQAARNGVKRLKLVRHPNILTFKDTMELEEKGETVIYLVTEPVTPLATILTELDIEGPARSEYVAMGLYNIAKAVSFLNNDCSLVHGNVCMRAVVVTPTLDWRLHGFDLLSEHASAGDIGGSWALPASTWMVGPQYKSAEVAKSEWQAVRQAPPWAIDAWGLGCLLQEAFGGRELARTEDLRSTENIPKAILQDYQRLLASAPTRRLNPAKLVESGVLKNKLVDTISFLENLAVKDSAEKDMFFKRLPSAVPQLPQPVAQLKLLPMLAGALEFGGAPASALGPLLQIGQTLGPDDFQARVVPSLSKLFASNDRSVRRSLLESIDSYGPHLTESAVEEQIYPHVATGFTDSNAYLRELTLKSMLVLGPKLSQRTLNQSLLKFLAKLQVDEEAAIRANTTILLGNLSNHLSEPACKRVLLNAFTRALKDSFPPARIAGLKAMVATAVMHSADEAATRIVPAAAPLTVDPVQEVRHTALAAVDVFVQILRDHNHTLDDTLIASGTANRDLQQGQTTSGWTVGLNSNLGWAMSSFGLARGKDAASSSPAATASTTSAAGAAPTLLAPEAPHGRSASFGAAPAASISAAAPATAASEGWDNNADSDEGWDEPDPEEQAARARLSRMHVRPPLSPTDAIVGGREPGGGAAASSGPAGGMTGAGAQTARWTGNGDDRWEDMDSASNASLGSAGSAANSLTGAGRGAAARQARGAVARRGAQRLGAQRTSNSGARPTMKLGAQKLNTKPEDNFEF